MDKFILKFDGDKPKYIQIANHIKELISKKHIEDGEKLPAIRSLSTKLNVNTVTIVNAYNKLKDDGFAYQKMGSGTYAKRKAYISKIKKEYLTEVKELMDKELDVVDFTGESLKDVDFPIDIFKGIINKVLDRDGAAALISKEPLGYVPLRKTLNYTFWDNKLDYNKFIIVTGAQQGIDIASKAVLNINDNVVVEKPTYSGAVSVFKWRRANIFEVSIDDDGINLMELEEILKKNKITLIYLMTLFHNPTGNTYSEEKMIKLLELAEKYDFYIVEDDYLGELSWNTISNHKPLKKYDIYDRVIYIKSFSKIFLPGIRLGYMIYPQKFYENMQSSKINTDMAASTLMQRALELYVKDGHYINHLAEIYDKYNEKYLFAKEILDNELKGYISYIDPKGGLGFYLKLRNNNIDSNELFYMLKQKGVYITPGATFYNKNNEGNDTFRIIFAGCSLENIKYGLMMIKEVLNKCNTSL